jgi:2',3'-cyclic-nucleotide 2'-phosphodiesterase
LRVLFIGDLIGEPGRAIVASQLPRLRSELQIDICLANGENAAGGFGITPAVASQLFSLGIDLLTTGNHVWDRKEIESFVQEEPRLLRPANYPPDVPGRGFHILKKDKECLGVLNLSGRTFMSPLDCPFRTAEREVARMKEKTRALLIDFHAEATSEKKAFGWFMAGKVSAVIGTHTHVQTADEQILPGQTAYITDVGMTGSAESVIGIAKEDAIARFLTQMPKRYHVAKDAAQLNSVMVEIDDEGRAIQIVRINRGGGG